MKEQPTTEKAPRARKKRQAPEAAVVVTETKPMAREENLVQRQESDPDRLIALAVEKGLGVEQLEKLMQLQERWLARVARENYYAALSKFQAEVPEIKKSTRVFFETRSGQTEYWFAELGQSIEHVKPFLYANGLAREWKIRDTKDEKGVPMIEVTTVITHVGGHKEETTMSAYLDDSGSKNTIQQRGSTISYLQRYTFEGALGIKTTSDNDARGATPPQGKSGPGKDQNQGKEEAGPKADTKPVLTDDLFKKALGRISKGEDILGLLQQTYTVTDIQLKALEAVAPKKKEPAKDEPKKPA